MPTSQSIFIPSSLSRYRYITYKEKNRTDHSILYPTSFVHSPSISHQEINIISVHLWNIIPLFLLEVDRWHIDLCKGKDFQRSPMLFPIWVFFLNGFIPTSMWYFTLLIKNYSLWLCSKVSHIVPNEILHTSRSRFFIFRLQIKSTNIRTFLSLL